MGGVSQSWFISLLERLRALSDEPIEAMTYDLAKRDQLRYHEIDWTQKNIPIQRTDLDWIPKDYLDNPAEYRFFQVSISTALGRVIGFWDEQSVFNIVLLDPLHNMQPAAQFGYRVRATTIGDTPHADVLEQLQRLRAQTCKTPDCEFFKSATRIRAVTDRQTDLLMLRVDSETIELAHQLVSTGKAVGFSEIFETGILSYPTESES